MPVASAPCLTTTSPVAAWAYTVSVRSLCDFTAKRGDLDRRFTPSATALEGLAGQAGVAARRGSGYEREIALEGLHGALRVRGRADGYDPQHNRLEEIKTVRGDPAAIPANRSHLHWAQVETYAALLCRSRGLSEVELALVYVDAATQAETLLTRRATAAELEAAFAARCAGFLAWAEQEAGHRSARDAGLAALPFPPGEFRPGQRDLAEAVYRASVAGRCLLAQAPTGIGKTVGTLYPMLRAMPGQRLDQIAWLTCKTTGRGVALQTLDGLREATPGRALRVLVMVARDEGCVHPDKACHGAACPLASGFYDRLPAARSDAVTAGWLDAAAQRAIALRHGICPYHFGHELLRWSDVVVGDVHHAFDPNGQWHALVHALGLRAGLLIDEAHNLLERARKMYSAALSTQQIDAAWRAAPVALRPPIGRLLNTARRSVATQDADYAAHAEVPAPLRDALQSLNAALGEHFDAQPPASGPPGALLGFYFESLRFQRAVERLASHSIFDIERTALARPVGDEPAQRSMLELDDDATADAVFSIRNVVPAVFLRPRFQACHSAVLFSATLGPPAYARDLLGLPDDCVWIDLPPAFAAEQLEVRIVDRVSTRYPHRQASLAAVADLIARQCARHPGNYLAFFSSFDYLEQAAARLAQRAPELAQWRQSRAMDEAARRAFLQRFVAGGRGVGFAVLGGAFAEGIDLPGTRLIGAFVATLGLPPPSPVQEQLRDRLAQLFGAGHGYADLVPGLQKVVQAAGRVIRSPEDRGYLWLMDDRYRQPAITRLLPAWWQIGASTSAPREAAASLR